MNMCVCVFLKVKGVEKKVSKTSNHFKQIHMIQITFIGLIDIYLTNIVTKNHF